MWLNFFLISTPYNSRDQNILHSWHLPDLHTKAVSTQSFFFFFYMRSPYTCIWNKDKNYPITTTSHTDVNITLTHPPTSLSALRKVLLQGWCPRDQAPSCISNEERTDTTLSSKGWTLSWYLPDLFSKAEGNRRSLGFFGVFFLHRGCLYICISDKDKNCPVPACWYYTNPTSLSSTRKVQVWNLWDWTPSLFSNEERTNTYLVSICQASWK